MSSISKFKAVVSYHGGVAVANRYAVFLNLPPSAASAAGISGYDVNTLCDGTSLPGRNIITFDYQAQRQSIKLPNGYANEDVSLTWTLTNDYAMKLAFDAWMQLVVNTDAYRANYNSKYVADVTIYQLDVNDIPVYGVTLRKAYPITSNGIDLSNTSENSPQKYTVTLTYDDFVVLDAPLGGFSFS